MQNPRQIYRLRAPASGREALAPAEPGGVYIDRETGEEMEPVTRTLPLAPSESALLRTPENLRICRRCDAADRPRRQRLPLLRPAPARALSIAGRPPAALAALALIAVCAGLAACGDDEPETTSSSSTTTETTSTTTETTTEHTTPTSTTTTTTEPDDDDEGGASGGTAAPEGPEGHEGGGPDPGTGEGESGSDDDGGASPPEAFDEFCEQNPAACE